MEPRGRDVAVIRREEHGAIRDAREVEELDQGLDGLGRVTHRDLLAPVELVVDGVEDHAHRAPTRAHRRAEILGDVRRVVFEHQLRRLGGHHLTQPLVRREALRGRCPVSGRSPGSGTAPAKKAARLTFVIVGSAASTGATKTDAVLHVGCQRSTPWRWRASRSSRSSATLAHDAPSSSTTSSFRDSAPSRKVAPNASSARSMGTTCSPRRPPSTQCWSEAAKRGSSSSRRRVGGGLHGDAGAPEGPVVAPADVAAREVDEAPLRDVVARECDGGLPRGAARAEVVEVGPRAPPRDEAQRGAGPVDDAGVRVGVAVRAELFERAHRGRRSARGTGSARQASRAAAKRWSEASHARPSEGLDARASRTDGSIASSSDERVDVAQEHVERAPPCESLSASRRLASAGAPARERGRVAADGLAEARRDLVEPRPNERAEEHVRIDLRGDGAEREGERRDGASEALLPVAPERGGDGVDGAREPRFEGTAELGVVAHPRRPAGLRGARREVFEEPPQGEGHLARESATRREHEAPREVEVERRRGRRRRRARVVGEERFAQSAEALHLGVDPAHAEVPSEPRLRRDDADLSAREPCGEVERKRRDVVVDEREERLGARGHECATKLQLAARGDDAKGRHAVGQRRLHRAHVAAAVERRVARASRGAMDVLQLGHEVGLAE